MNSCQRLLTRLPGWPLLLATCLFLAACADYRKPERANLGDVAKASEGILIVGTAYDSGGFAGTHGYKLNFKRLDGQERLVEDRSKGLMVPRYSEDEEHGTGVLRKDLSEVKYYIFKLEPGNYVVFSVYHLYFENQTRVISCFRPPALGFRIAAGQTLYVGNIILEEGARFGSFAVKKITRDDSGARAALAAKGGDPSKMQSLPLQEVDYRKWRCRDW